MTISKLKIFTIGTVAANKPLSSKDIEFTPDEHIFFANGIITDNAETVNSSGITPTGQNYENKLTTTLTMRATWLPIGSDNRKTAPDVRIGERVVIYQFADTNKYYWVTLFDDVRLRKLETVIYAYSNIRDEADMERADNTYFIEVSTHRKYIHLHTSKNDGEPFSYDIQINTGKGYIQITDDVGNVLELDSADTKITLKNIDESYMVLDKQNIFVNAKNNIEFTAGNDFKIKAGNNFSLDAGVEITETAGGSITTQAPQTTNNVPSTTNNGTQTTVGLTTTGGLASVATGGSAGGITASGPSEITGDVTINGNIATNGNIAATGSVTGSFGNFPNLD